MKKLLSILAILMMAMTSWADELTVVEVTTWQGIQNYLKDADKGSKVCKLICDIDFNGGTIEPLDKGLNTNYQNPLSSFTIDGDGHTIKNGTVTDMVLLSYVKNGTIKNLKFDNIKSCLVSHAYAPFQFENLSFNNCSVTTNEYAGLVCEQANGTAQNKITFSDITVTNCSVAGGVSLITSGYNDDSCPVGVLAGYAAYNTISNCHVSKTNVNGYIVVGGLIGWSYGANVTNCSFLGKVYANGYNLKEYAIAGGIAGKATGSSKISNCQNYGEVEANDDKVGGIAGYAINNTTIENCKNTGWIHHKSLSGSDDEIGGILGYGSGVQISKCINAGSIDGGDAYVGGIAGLLEGNSSISHCVNAAFVNGDEEVGGIAGQIKDQTTVSYCIGASDRIEGNTNVQKLVGAEPTGSTHDNYWISNTSGIDVGAVTADDLKSGKVTWHINNKLAVDIWTQNLETDAYPIIGTAGVHYARTMAKEWGTVVLPFDVAYDQSNGNYKFYKLSAVDRDYLTVTECDEGTIAAGTPMVVKKLTGDGIDITPASTPNYSTTITEQTSDNASLPAGWSMNGTYSNLTNQTEIYFVAQDKFWYAESPITIAPFRAWFTGPTFTSSSSAALRINVADDDTEDIELISDADGTLYMVNGQCFDLQGRQTNEGQKGLQIRNGKVVLLK